MLTVAICLRLQIENLQRCESLQKLDFTMCFVDKVWRGPNTVPAVLSE